MKESKLSYVALTISVGAIVFCGISGMLSVFPNTAKIDALTDEVQILKSQNSKLREQMASTGENRHMIDELDIGLTAMASVMHIDHNVLARAIAAARTRQNADPESLDAQPDPTIPPTGEPTVTAVSEPQLTQQIKQPPTAPAAAAGTDLAPTGVAKQKPSTEPLQRTAEQTATKTPSIGPENPFAAGVGTSNAGGEVPATLAVTSTKNEPFTIAQVDSILGKRLSSTWYQPVGTSNDISAIIQVKMNRDGKVATVRLTKSSGNAAFDASAINAVQSIGAIEEVKQLSDADFQKAYASRSIQFTPQMGG